MSQVKVQFRSPQEVMDFTYLVSRYDYHMDIKKSKNKMADAKSLLGILALGLNNNLELCIYADEDCADVVNAIDRYVVS